ncbi:hypothetical protein [Sphingomonas sp. M1A8_2b]
MTHASKRFRVTNLKLREISTVDHPAQAGALAVLIKSAGALSMTDIDIRKNAAAVAKGEPATFTRLQYEDALLKRAEELADKQGVTPEQALSANLTTDSTIRDLTNAYEVANAAEYGSTIRKRYAGAGA